MGPIVVKELEEQDRWRLRPHFRALESRDRHLRFGLVLDEDALGRYVDQIDFNSEAVFAVVSDAGELLASAHIAQVGAGAELGLSVLPAHRRRGMGSALFGRAISWARDRGIRTVYMHCLRENGAILRLARTHGMALSSEGPESRAVLRLPKYPVAADALAA